MVARVSLMGAPLWSLRFLIFDQTEETGSFSFLVLRVFWHDMIRIDLREQIENIANNPDYVQ